MRMGKTRMNIYLDEDVKKRFTAVCGSAGKSPSWLFECFARYVVDSEHLKPWGRAVISGMGRCLKDSGIRGK
jgi:hypothetical protein